MNSCRKPFKNHLSFSTIPKWNTGELGYDGLNGTRKIGLSYAKSVVYIWQILDMHRSWTKHIVLHMQKFVVQWSCIQVHLYNSAKIANNFLNVFEKGLCTEALHDLVKPGQWDFGFDYTGELGYDRLNGTVRKIGPLYAKSVIYMAHTWYVWDWDQAYRPS